MKNVIPIELSVSIFNDYVDDLNIARVTLTEELIAWIKKMEKIVQDNDIAYIADYECSPEYFQSDNDVPPEISPYEGSTECDMIVIRKGSFYWKGVIKHTDVRFETESFSIEDIEEILKFYKEPLEDMPRYLHDEDYSKREIASYRMKGDKKE